MYGNRNTRWEGDRLYISTRSTGYSIVRDQAYPTMWRVRSPDGALSDMVNRARAVALPAANGMNARIGLDGQGWASAAFEPRAITAAMIAGYQLPNCLKKKGGGGGGGVVMLGWWRRRRASAAAPNLKNAD
jgi:hypothetical protein